MDLKYADNVQVNRLGQVVGKWGCEVETCTTTLPHHLYAYRHTRSTLSEDARCTTALVPGWGGAGHHSPRLVIDNHMTTSGTPRR